ncbi:hypothetical protein cyc_02593 [Cyclospora cayetanensis]|uniref:Transmembrane protein n=1 Tax=Cyclospora cayetanensis TaxID=88456 RepID=A0A1D3CUQ7_9EIME|nr:hypothetical protein cyc_02593 [Cyclospora cayetanensis]
MAAYSSDSVETDEDAADEEFLAENSGPIQELVLHLQNSRAAKAVSFREADSKRENLGYMLLSPNLGPADRFAVAVSLFSCAVLLLLLTTRVARGLKGRLSNNAKIRRRPSHKASKASNTHMAEIMGLPDATPQKSAPEAPVQEEHAIDTEDLEDSGGPKRSGSYPREPTVERNSEVESEDEEREPKKVLSPRVLPRRHLLALNPVLQKEEKKLRRLEEALIRMELESPPRPGPEEFILGVLSRVLDIQHLGRRSDA